MISLIKLFCNCRPKTTFFNFFFSTHSSYCIYVCMYMHTYVRLIYRRVCSVKLFVVIVHDEQSLAGGHLMPSLLEAALLSAALFLIIMKNFQLPSD